eukprot:gene8602-10214_t
MSALDLDELRALVWSFAQSVDESQLPSAPGPGPSLPSTDLGSQSSLPQECVLTPAKSVPEVAVWIAPSTSTVTTDVREEPLTTCTLLAARGNTSAVWVSVSVPREASAGDYVGTIMVKNSGAGIAGVDADRLRAGLDESCEMLDRMEQAGEVRLRVWEFTLPMTPRLPFVVGVSEE